MRVTFDLPCVEKKEDITLTATGDELSIDAIMRRSVNLRLTGARQTHAEFERYSKRIRLPAKVNPEKVVTSFAGGFLMVRLPIRFEGKAVKID